MAPKSFLLALLAFGGSTLLPLASARTDLEGCISTRTTNQWGHASMLWYVPGTGEICDFPDCGGGRAPPKSTVPGCGHYTGTETVTPSYIVLSTSTPATRTSTTASPSGGGEDDPSDSVITSPPSPGQTTSPTTEPTGSGESAEEGGAEETATATGTESGSTGAPVSTPFPDAAAGMGVAGSMMAGIIAVAGLVVL